MKKISKTFGDVRALNEVDFSVNKGEIHALLGENGAGKTTLMNILFGFFQPEHGEIFLNQDPVKINSPRKAQKYKIAMVHQHFMLASAMTVAENIALSIRKSKTLFYSLREIEKKIKGLEAKFGLEVNPHDKIEELTVGELQRVEILKALAHDSIVLILDEPTSLLAPQEIEKLFSIFRKLKQSGVTLVFITHKVKEVKELCDRATILKKGVSLGSFNVKDLSESEIALKMVEQEMELNAKKPVVSADSEYWISLKNITIEKRKHAPAVEGLSLSLLKGEIVCIVGVEGNGQKELVDLVRGRQSKYKGVRDCTVRKIGYIPSDRQNEGLVLNMSIEENFLLEPSFLKQCSRYFLLNLKKINRFARHLIQHYFISASSEKKLVKNLSGGNQQKIVVARELALKPEALVAVNPSWGLDVKSARYVHKKIMELSEQKVGLLIVTIDLEEAILLADKIFALVKGSLIPIPKENWNYEKIGLAITGAG